MNQNVPVDSILECSEARMQCMELWGGNQRVHSHLQLPGLEAWVFSQPHHQASGGGDVYFVSSCASGRITRLLLADVSGHGADVSKTAVGLRDLMRRNVNIIEQTGFVRAMNSQFNEMSSDQHFATAVVCSYFSPTRSLTLCNAGHPDPLCLRQQEGRWVSMTQQSDAQRLSDIPWGVIDGADYNQLSTQLSSGDLVLLFSDAFIEAVDADGRQLGAAGLIERVSQLDASEPADMLRSLISRIQHDHPANLSGDDSTLMLIRATDSKATIKNTLLSPFRLLRQPTERLELVLPG